MKIFIADALNLHKRLFRLFIIIKEELTFFTAFTTSRRSVVAHLFRELACDGRLVVIAYSSTDAMDTA